MKPRRKYGTLGSVGVGEMTMVPTAPAIINAIKNATGAWVLQLPGNSRTSQKGPGIHILIKPMSAHAENTNQTTGATRRVRNLAGREILFDEQDFFWNFNDWSEEVAEMLAREEGMNGLQ